MSGAEGRSLTQADMVGLDRVSDPHVSIDGKWAVYDLAVLSPGTNKRVHSLWVVATDGKSAPTRWAEGYNPRWGPDDRSIYYLSKGEVWEVCPSCQTSAPKKVTNLPLEVGSFRLAPDGRRMVVSMAVFPDAEDPAETKARQDAAAQSKASGRLYTKLFVRHWDAWDDGTRSHLFSLALSDGVAQGSPTPLMKGFDGDSPMKPGGGDEDYAISPDGETVVFSARLAGRTEAWSTNFNLFSTPIDGSAAPVDVTAANKAWDGRPVFSPDGGRKAYLAMKRPGFEADRMGVMIADAAGHQAREVDPGWDRSASTLAFSGDGRSLYAVAAEMQKVKLFALDTRSGAVRPLTDAGHVGTMDVAHGSGGDVIVYTQDTFDHPPEIYALRPGSAPVQLTHATDRQLAGVQMSSYESFKFPGWNGDEVHGWVMKPSGWKPGQRYPTVLLIHGGPQASWTDSWNTRWNPEVWAGWGYGLVMIDVHGSTGYGQAFTDAVSGHWGDRPLQDLQKGWTAAQAKYGWLNGDRACAAGWSFGGYMAYWMAGVWNTPWKCLIVQDGIFDNRLMGYATDELWAYEWENGGSPPWRAPADYERFNPVDHVANWSKPMLIIHSEKDFRIPIDQAIGAFTALQRKDVPSAFLTFPDENHWVQKPQDSLQWHDVNQAWLSRWVPPSGN